MIKEILAEHYPDQEFRIRALSGGDINEAYEAESADQHLCVKLNSASRYPKMLEQEAAGLRLLDMADDLRVPMIYHYGELHDQQYLIMEFIKGGLRSKKMWETFGRGLACLHSWTEKKFGLDHSNYIGSLVQQNEWKGSWAEFLITQRFEPMLKMAMNNGHISATELAQFSKFQSHVEDIWPLEAPALLHGDLWSGNYLPAENDEPCIIDPAVYYGHREIDIGMMHLFGGFSNELFEAYDDEFPLEKGWQDRIPYNQLYPLLVHVNLFGRSYWSGIQRIISAF